MKKKNGTPIFVKAYKELRARLAKAARLTDRSISQIVRDGTRKELDEIAKDFPELKAA